MSETRARKQVSVLSRISLFMPKANDFVVEVSSRILSPSITLDALQHYSSDTRSLYSQVAELLSDLREFCNDDSQTKFLCQLLQIQGTLASLSTSIMSHTLNLSNQTQTTSMNMQVLEALKHLVQSSRMPLSEPTVFSGDPLDYALWRNEINAFVDRDTVSAAEKIHCLKKYTAGPARECIDGYLAVFTNDSYLAARNMLDTRFGNRFVVTFAFRDKLENWPKIPSNDFRSLEKFSDFLKEVQSKLSVLNTLDVLNDPKENYKMLKVLPQWMVNKWADKIAEYQEQNNDDFPPFANFVTFVGAQAKRMNNPIISQLSSSSKSFSSNQGYKSFSSCVSHCISLKASISSRYSCLLCGGSHSLQKCYKFIGFSYDNRVAFIKENRLCFGCFNSGHQSKDCRNRLKCEVCQKSHSTLLHNSAFL